MSTLGNGNKSCVCVCVFLLHSVPCCVCNKTGKEQISLCDFEVLLPHHEGFVHRVSQLEGVVTDSQVVLQSERLQHDAIPYWECQTQVIAGIPFN